MLRFPFIAKNILSKVCSTSTVQNVRIATSPINFLKEIRETRKEKTITIEGVAVSSPREPYLVKTTGGVTDQACPVCRLGLDIKHTDVLILSQFVRPDGCMLPSRITGLCKKQQQRMSSLVSMAHKAGLMPNLKPANCRRSPHQRYRWKKYNTYFDESTIVLGPPRYWKRKPILEKFDPIQYKPL